MKKSERQRLIRQLIKEYAIDRQEELVEHLNREGIDVTQATVSRDIKEMQLIKVSDHNGAFRYSESTPKSASVKDKFKKMINEYLISINQMEKFVSIKTVPGSATALGILTEKIYNEELFSLITNDDKVLMIFYSEEMAKQIREEIYNLVY